MFHVAHSLQCFDFIPVLKPCRLDWGIAGLALAYNLVNGIGLLIEIAIVWRLNTHWQAPQERTWPKRLTSSSLFGGWGQYLGTALPSLAMICANWWVSDDLHCCVISHLPSRDVLVPPLVSESITKGLPLIMVSPDEQTGGYSRPSSCLLVWGRMPVCSSPRSAYCSQHTPWSSW